VRVLLAGKSDVPLMQCASRSLYRRLVSQGVEFWEYQPQVLHAKWIGVDDLVFVGSANRDPRSLRINFEIMLRIQDATLAATARQKFEADLAQRAIPITRETLKHGRSWWQRLTQRFAYYSESASHGADDACHQIVDTYRLPGLRSCSSPCRS
jgi:cardiolipin synthase